MKPKDNNLFDFLDFILKNKKDGPKEYKPPTFLINRWLSMASPAFAKILNLTTNKWCRFDKDFDIKMFYRIILPKYNKKISYIKKENSETDTCDDISNIANVMECSEREIELFNKTLAELKVIGK